LGYFVLRKKIGIVGGLSPESTIYYYQYITHEYMKRFGDYSYPKIIIYSVNFQEYIDWGTSGDWKSVEDDVVASIDALARAGADFAIIATNTMHYVYDGVIKRVKIPVISLVEAVCQHAKTLNVKRLALLGTKFTMRQDFYKKALAKVDIETLVPRPDKQAIVHDVIFNELGKGIIKDESKTKYLDIINELVSQGAEGVILGCTEIPLLIKQADLEIPVLDSSQIHAQAAFEYALE